LAEGIYSQINKPLIEDVYLAPRYNRIDLLGGTLMETIKQAKQLFRQNGFFFIMTLYGTKLISGG
jgi:hypothetical protein